MWLKILIGILEALIPDETFVKATFKLDNNEIKQGNEILGKVMSTDTVTFSKNKDMKLKCYFHTNSYPLLFVTFRTNYLDPITDIISRIDPSSFDNGQEQLNGLLNTCRTIGGGNSRQCRSQAD